MKRIIVFVALVCVGMIADAAYSMSKAGASFFNNRRICVKRDTTTLPGYVITTWHRNGKPDTLSPAVVTNAIRAVTGAEQKNPLQTLVSQWRAVATNQTARIERVTSALDTRRAEYVQKRDAATLPTTKAIYQAFIDAIDRIKAEMDR